MGPVMSTPIKPAGEPPHAPPVLDQQEGIRSGERAGGAEAGFRTVLVGASGRSGTAGGTMSAVAPEATGNLAQAIADDLRSGKIDGATAVERVVQKALESDMASRLSSEERSGLEAFIRRALEEDPTLRALVDDLGRAE